MPAALRAYWEKIQPLPFIAMLLLALLAVSLLLGYWYWHNLALIDDQHKRNAYLQSTLNQVTHNLDEVKRLEALQQALAGRMQLVQSLQTSRPQNVYLLDELVKIVPDGAQLTELKQTGSVIRLSGRAASNAHISHLMRNITSSPWLSDPQLLLVEQKQQPDDLADDGGKHFSLSIRQALPTGAENDFGRAKYTGFAPNQ